MFNINLAERQLGFIVFAVGNNNKHCYFLSRIDAIFLKEYSSKNEKCFSPTGHRLDPMQICA